jgi:hypothetical protein
MSNTTWGLVKDGVIIPDTALPEGVRVEIVIYDGPLEIPAELRAEFDAWEVASSHALDLVERQATQEDRNAKG